MEEIESFAYVTAPDVPAASNLSDDARRPKVRDDYFVQWNGLETFAGVSLSLKPGEKRLLPLFLAERFVKRYPNADFQLEVSTERIELRPMLSGVPCPFCNTQFPDRETVKAHAMECSEGPMAAVKPAAPPTDKLAAKGDVK